MSLTGRVLIVKALALSKFQYLASLVNIPENIIKQVNRIVYEFIWSGKTDKVKRILFEQNYNKGGYKMINFSDIVVSSSVMWVKKYLDSTDKDWKYTFEWLSKKQNLRLYLMSNFEVHELPKHMPQYYVNSIINWSRIKIPSSEVGKNDVSSQCLWCNKNLKIGGKTVYNARLFSTGLWVVQDLFENGILLSFETLLQRGAREMDRMTWFGMIRCVDKTYNFQDLELNAKPLTINTGMILNSKFVSIDKLTQKHIRASFSEVKFSSLKESDLKHKIKHEKLHGILTDEQWENIFLVPRIAPVDNKIKDLQYKIFMRFLPTNYLLFKMKKNNSQTCVFCMLEPETIEHLLFDCVHVRNIWLHVFIEWQNVTGHNFEPTLQSCIFGIFDKSVQYINEINIIILLVKSYIMKCKYENIMPSPEAVGKMFSYKVSLLSQVRNIDLWLLLKLMFQN